MTADERERVRALIERLRDERDRHGGRLPDGLARHAALNCGIGVSTLYRYLNVGIPQRDRPRWKWGTDELAALQAAGGEVSFARRILAEDPEYGRALPSERWMQTVRHRDLALDTMALHAEGTAAAKQHQIVVVVETATGRNQLWIIDHFQLSCWASPEHGNDVRPWVTIVHDSFSRRVLGAAVSVRPTQAHALAALRMAIAEAGVPGTLLFDRGAEFIADAVTQAAIDLVFAVVSTLARHPEHRGKAERLVQTLKRWTAREFPQRTTAAKDRAGDPIIRVKDTQRKVIATPPLENLIRVFYAKVEEYNAARHRTLHASPDRVYAEDPSPERRVRPELLRRFLLKEGTRKIREHGIRFKNHWYYAPALDGYRGATAEIRYAPDDLTRLEVYRTGGDESWWCTARLVDPASAELRERVLHHRKLRAQEQQKLTRQARRAAQRRYAAVVGVGPVRDTTPVTRAEAIDELRRAPTKAGEILRLLGLSGATSGSEDQS